MKKSIISLLSAIFVIVAANVMLVNADQEEKKSKKESMYSQEREYKDKKEDKDKKNNLSA